MTRSSSSMASCLALVSSLRRDTAARSAPIFSSYADASLSFSVLVRYHRPPRPPAATMPIALRRDSPVASAKSSGAKAHVRTC